MLMLSAPEQHQMQIKELLNYLGLHLAHYSPNYLHGQRSSLNPVHSMWACPIAMTVTLSLPEFMNGYSYIIHVTLVLLLSIYL